MVKSRAASDAADFSLLRPPRDRRSDGARFITIINNTLSDIRRL